MSHTKEALYKFMQEELEKLDKEYNACLATEPDYDLYGEK